MYRYLKRVGIQRRKTIVDGVSGIPKQDRVVPTETPKRFLETPKARYGYTESHRDDGDVTRYPGALTDAEWALVSDLFEHDERTHSFIERPRRLSKDYDRLPDVSAAWIWLAETRILLRRLSNAESV